MKVEILTIFPEIFSGFLSTSLVAKSIERNLLSVNVLNIRDFAEAPHYQVDDTPYGGGAGMVMKPEPLTAAIESAKQRLPQAPVLLLSPRGTPFQQKDAAELSEKDGLILVCVRYEGVDQRVIELLVDREYSIGDYIVMGGEVPAMVLLESALRLIPGVVGNIDSLQEESFRQVEGGGQLLEAPQYTRPAEFREKSVPEVLLSGDHVRVTGWRKEQALSLTRDRRPDLLAKEKPTTKK